MQIKDIVNNNLANLENCESEPIHIPGTIQPFGFLLAVRENDFIIEYCSGNCIDYLKYSHQQLLNQPLGNFFGAEEIKMFAEYCSQASIDAALPFVFKINDGDFNTTIHKTNGLLVLELEPFPDGSMHLQTLYVQTKKFVRFIEKAENLACLCRDIADETRGITGYDRVVIYKFDKDYNGEIFAESIAENIEPWLGLHYPHTDIPVQARELYLKNLLRMIADVEYKPIPIYTIDDAEEPGKNLDMSLAVLRSVSPMHLEYLRNMGTSATLTISLIHNKKLWGLISCHHSEPRNIPHFIRLAAQMQGHFLTSQIDVRQVADEYELSKTTEGKLKLLLDRLVVESDLKKLFNNRLLFEPVRADGVIIIDNNKTFSAGDIPNNKDLSPLIEWLGKTQPTGKYSTSKLADDYPAARGIKNMASGIMYFSLGKSVEKCIVWFRKELIETVLWVGDPEEALLKKDGKQRLHPRRSFETWKELVGLQSKEWNKIEIQAAEKIASALERQMHLDYLQQEEINSKLLNEKLQSANDELANINWISIHDLKEPLRKIQVFGSLILEKETPGANVNVKHIVGRMQKSAKRMQLLIDDLLVYSKIFNEKESFDEVNLNQLLASIKAEYMEDMVERDFVLTVEAMPVLKGIGFQIKQLFVNLLNNCFKFSREDIGLVVNIAYEKANGFVLASTNTHIKGDYHKISVTDNGIGFDTRYATKIFQLFQRLHTEDYTGTGMGLAICKKIMDNHSGYIDAQGIEGASSTFTIYFPA